MTTDQPPAGTAPPTTGGLQSPTFRSLAVILVLLLIGAFLSTLLAPQAQKPSLSVRSDERNGAMALRLWLERSGYQVSDRVSIPADLDQVDLLFVLQPAISYSPEMSNAVKAWVRRGNTLIAGGSPFAIGTLMDAFDVQIGWVGAGGTVFTPASPILDQPPVDSVSSSAPIVLYSQRDDVIPYLFNDTDPVLVSFRDGEGTVWVSALLDPFTNAGIQDEQNARLILNMLATVKPGARIAFDEGLYAFGEGAMTLDGWLFGTAPGLGVLGIIALTFVYLYLRGRRFGSPLPLARETLRREPVEYIHAIARLFRRAGGRDDLLRHYQRQFKRRLSIRYGVDPSLPDAEFVAHLVYRDPGLDEAALRDLLVRLDRSAVTEAYVLQTVNDADHLLGTML